MKIKHWLSLSSAATLLIVMIGAAASGANTLYTLNQSGELLSVDPQTGSTTLIVDGLGAGSWNALAASPTDSNFLFAINNPRPATLDESTFSRLARISLETGDPVLFPLFSNEILGFPRIFSTGIAISLTEPNVAIISGSDSEIPPQPFLFRVDIATGEVLEPAKRLDNVRRIESLTFDLDGTLYGTNQDGELVTIDPQTAKVSVVGDPQLTDFLTGLAFEPNDGTLFAIDGLRNDHLVSLDALTGTLTDNIGPLGIAGPEGLAFVAGIANSLDCSGDGLTDVADLACSNASDTTQQLLSALSLLAGDFDGKNGVDFGDFLVLSDNFGKPLGRYIDGDIDDNGRVEFADFLKLSSNFGRSSAASLTVVPEPGGLTLLVIALAAGLRWVEKKEVAVHYGRGHTTRLAHVGYSAER